MYRQAYLELRELMAQNPELAEKVASEIMGGIEKEASAVPTFTEVMEKVATMFPEEVALLQKIAFNFADAMHAQGLSQEELEKKLGRVAFKNDPVGAVSKKVNQATDAIGTAASGAAGTISDTVLGAGDTVKEVAGGVKETVGKKTNAIKDGIKGIADDITVKSMDAGDAVKGGIDDALLKAMSGVDWMKANPGKAALIGGGAAGAGISAVALLNAIKNSKDEKVAAVWNEFIEKKASEKAQVSLPNEILKFAGVFLDPEVKANASAAREVAFQDPEDYLNAIQMLAYKDYEKKQSNPQGYRGPFEAGSRANFDLTDLLNEIKNNPEYKHIQKIIDRDNSNTGIGAILGSGAGMIGGGVLGGKINKKLNPERFANEALEISSLGTALGGLGGALGGAMLGERTVTPAMAKLDPEKIQEYLLARDGAPHETLKKY